ncbi:MAG: hypothetical protein IPJ74_08530 [Saprospiraceae bacterium]|nr:hypothetical protein [Saprospiraceae bacterium]
MYASPSTYKDYGFKQNGTEEYQYDANGNLIFDPHKDMDVVYNFLNLPERIEFADCKTIEFTYDAGGNKLKKELKNGTMLLATHDYLGSIEYKGSELEAIYHDEGRVYYEEGTGRYEFNIRDHLGNTRLTFTDKDNDDIIEVSSNPATNEILQENHYYPFGMNMNGQWMANPGRNDKYQYNGKELNEDFGLNWYDYGARWYMADIGRWGQVDPLADDFYSFTPYNNVFNNPMRFIDPDGKSAVPTVDKKNKIITINAQLNFYGSGATDERAIAIAAAIQKDWNAANGAIEIDGETYAVQFNVTGKKISGLTAAIGKVFGGAENNYINLSEGGPSFRNQNTRREFRELVLERRRDIG